MQRMTIAVAATLFASWLWAGESDPIHERHEMMEDTRDALKPMAQMVKGERDFDAATVSAGFATMQNTAEHFGGLFPPGSETGGDTHNVFCLYYDYRIHPLIFHARGQRPVVEVDTIGCNCCSSSIPSRMFFYFTCPSQENKR